MKVLLCYFIILSLCICKTIAVEPYQLEGQNGEKVEVYIYGKEAGRLLCIDLLGKAMIVDISNLSNTSRDLVDIEVADGRPAETLDEFRFKVADALTRVEGRDRVQTSALFLKSAEEGHAEAQARISIGYYIGSGVEVNSIAAFRWAEKSAKGGSLEGKLCLGMYLYRGVGTTKHPRRAESLLKEVASSGSKRAHYLLGDFYSKPIDNRDYNFEKSISHYKESIGNAWWRNSTQRIAEEYEKHGVRSFSGVVAYFAGGSMRLQQVKMGSVTSTSGSMLGNSSSSIPKVKLLSDSATIQPISKVSEREAITKRITVFNVDRNKGLWEVFGIGDRIITAKATEVPQVDWASWLRDLEMWGISRQLDNLEMNYNDFRSGFW